MIIQSKYGFAVGDIVVTKIDLLTEYNAPVPARAELRIVAITPKVRMIPVDDPTRRDTKEYFYNAVFADQKEDYGHRIRENFVTIRKIKTKNPAKK